MKKRARLGRVWRRLLDTRRGRVELGAFGFCLVLLAATALEVAPALADHQKLAGQPVPAGDVTAIVSAALSCPALTPARVAAQVMAATGFAASSGDGIAGLDDSLWAKWKPATYSLRSDPQANIVALGHRTCELIGQIRARNIDGDLWQLAVAADHDSLAAVETAGGIPAADQTFVLKVTAYAYWYADQPQFTTASTARATATLAAATAIPADLVADVNAAGRICPSVTPARIAAQLRVASNFDPNLGSLDRQGIAQFTEGLWGQYRSGAKASVWDPDDAIPTLGAAMCDLSDQFVGLGGTDPYTLALAAFQWGPEAVRLAGGLPRANVPQLADQVPGYVTAYEKDTRLTTAAEPPASPSPSPAATTKDGTPAAASPSPSGTSAAATGSLLYDPAQTYQIQNVWAGAILDAPGVDVLHLTPGSLMHLWTAQRSKDQFWRIKPAATAGYVTITNAYDGLNLSVQYHSVKDAAPLELFTANAPGDPTQLWKLEDAGDGAIRIVNRNSGKVLDLAGADTAAPAADNTWNGVPVLQGARVTAQQDQKWRLIVS